MRKLVAHVLCATMLVTAAGSLTACRFEAEAKIGGGEKKRNSPPPPAPKKEEPKTEPKTPAPKFEQEKGSLKLPGPVVFETGSDKLAPESDEVLKFVYDYLKAKPEITLLRVEGHTDNVGQPADNQSLSERRSLSVARWLVGKGIDCKRILPVGFGDTRPIADNSTADGRAQNRRTAFVNAELKGKAIGGMPVDGSGKVAGDPCK